MSTIKVQHTADSSFREKLLEHLFVSEILRCLWLERVTAAEVLRPEVDSGGYDLVLSCRSVIRHIQLKSSFRDAMTRHQSINRRLSEKPSGCVVWIQFDPETLALGPFLWFGASPGQPLPDLSLFPIAKHTKANSQGVKVARPNIRRVPRSAFSRLASIPELLQNLLGDISPLRSQLSPLDAGEETNYDEADDRDSDDEAG
jgi:hypothetical protein